MALTGIMKSLLASVNLASVWGTLKSSVGRGRENKSIPVLHTLLSLTQISPKRMDVMRVFPQSPVSALIAWMCLRACYLEQSFLSANLDILVTLDFE